MTLQVHAPDGVPEVHAGDDLAALLLDALAGSWALTDGDVVAVTSKVVSKAEGRVVAGDRADALPGETARLVARRAGTVIVRHRLGLTLAAAGIDASNVEAGSVVLLPEDPDASARGIRADLAGRTGVNVGVVVTDTAGRAWRTGQTDIAIGVAGLVPVDDHRGRVDRHGHELAVTAPAVADEVAGATELVQGKLGARPFAVLRGLGAFVPPAGEDGPGAGALLRDDASDLFGYGAREAVLRALVGDPVDRAGFGAPVPAEELAGLVGELVGPGVPVVVGPDVLTVSSKDARLEVLAFACGWEPVPGSSGVDQRFRPVVP